MPRIKQNEQHKVQGETRQRLLEAAAEEFARVGYSEASINTISTSAGYAKGTIYNYFTSKREVLLVLIDETAREHFEFIVDQLRPESSSAFRLERLYRVGFDFISHRPAQSRVLFNTINGPDEAFKVHVFEAYQPLFNFVAQEILVLGFEQGVLRRVDPPSTALLLMTIYLGTASQLNPQGSPWLDPGQVAALVLHGLVIQGAES
jgi:AcrR family transcriptional regulator